MSKSPPIQSQRKFKTSRMTGTPGGLIAFFTTIGLNALAAVFGATQYIAFHFKYHPNLGAPLYDAATVPSWLGFAAMVGLLGFGAYLLRQKDTRRMSAFAFYGAAIAGVAGLGPLYSPFMLITWIRAYSDLAGFDAVMNGANMAAVASLIGSIACTIAFKAGDQVKDVSNSHGTAEWGTGNEFLTNKDEEKAIKEAVKNNVKTDVRGLIIGRHPTTNKLMFYKGDAHVLTLAPTRSGKGVGAVIPNLLYYPGSTIVTDVKGENFQVCGLRRHRMGQEVFALDPFKVTVDPSIIDKYDKAFNPWEFLGAYNPLELLDVVGPRKDFDIDDAQLLASMLIVDDGGGDSKHWVEEGKALIAGLLIHIAVESAMPPESATDEEYFVRNKDLLELRRLLTLSGESFDRLWEHMSHSPHEMARTTANRIMQKDEKERSGVISTAQSNTQFLDSKAMRSVLAADSPLRRIPMHELKSKEMSIFLVLPPKYLKSHAAWLRLMIVCANHALTSSQTPPKERVLFMLDEFANLGYMEPVYQGVSLVGGYGVTFWMLVQDLSQLKKVYKEGFGSLFGNCYIKQCFGTNDQDTAELLSKMVGETTIFSDSGSLSKGKSFGKSSGGSLNAGESTSEKGRKLLNPDEVMAMANHEQLLFVKESRPLVAGKVLYWKDPEFKGLWLPNPMHG